MVVLSKMRRTADEISALEKAKATLGVPPPIDFYAFETKRERKGEKTDSETERDEYRTFDVCLSHDEGRDDTYEVKIRIFRFGNPEKGAFFAKCEANVTTNALKKQAALSEPEQTIDVQRQTIMQKLQSKSSRRH